MNQQKQDCVDCRDLPEGEVVKGHDHRPSDKIQDAPESVRAELEQPVMVTVIHKPDNQHASKIVPLSSVRAFAEICVRDHSEKNNLYEVTDDYIVVSHYLYSEKVTVTTL